jgi:hypothetical protein
VLQPAAGKSRGERTPPTGQRLPKDCLHVDAGHQEAPKTSSAAPFAVKPPGAYILGNAVNTGTAVMTFQTCQRQRE